MERFKKFVANKTFYKYVLTLAVPLMVQQLVTSSVNLVDNLMIGQLGDWRVFMELMLLVVHPSQENPVLPSRLPPIPSSKRRYHSPGSLPPPE